MELRQLAYFRKVAELRSFSRAAAALRVTQPSLSRQIMGLEREVGARLFDRTPRGVEPTAAGRGLQRHLDGVFAQLDRIPEVVRTSGQSRELIRVGVPKGLPYDWGRQVLQAVDQDVPDASLSLHEGTTEEQRQLLQDGYIDIGLLHMDAPELHCVQLLAQPLGVCVQPGSALLRHRNVTFRDLDGLRVMAHAIGEIDVEVARLRSATAEAGADIEWLFRRFSDHSALIALASKADAVLVTETSAVRQFPDWEWIPMSGDRDRRDALAIRTWAAYTGHARHILADVVESMTRVSRGWTEHGPASGWTDVVGDPAPFGV